MRALLVFGLVTPSLAAAGQSVPVLVELSGPPAFAPYFARNEGLSARAVVAARQQLAANATAQEALVQAMQQAGIPVVELYRVQRLVNGVAVETERDSLPRLAQLPGVKAIRLIEPKKPALASTLPLIRAPQAWGSYGLTGRGVRVGIIDTGVDYSHRTFGSSGAFPNEKVVGGYDFAGDNYDAGSDDANKRRPSPDADPMDCNGHGTHVASIAAGLGVMRSGQTFLGPFGSATPLGELAVPPGVAPEASLYALKVFGCSGSTALVVRALEWAADPNGDGNPSDRLDIVNLSLGSSFGSNDDADAEAANRASQLDILVVAAAGNDGDTTFITSSPASATAALSVASSVDVGAVTGAFQVLQPSPLAGLYPASEAAFGPDLAAGDVEGLLAVPAAGEELGCEPFSPASTSALAAKIALINRGTCTFKRKVLNAQNAGAIGVLIVRQDNGDPFTMGNDSSITNPITIPAQMTVLSVGELLRQHVSQGVRLRLTARFRNGFVYSNGEREDTVSSFSSRGPRQDLVLKPELSAPGETVFAAARGSLTGGVSLSGTSMATPVVAGAAALLKEAAPQRSAWELKTLLINSADPLLFGSRNGLEPYHRLSRVGAGRLNIERAVTAPVLLWAADNPQAVAVSFALVQTPARVVKGVKVRNISPRPLELRFAATLTQPLAGVRLSVVPATLNLAAGEEGSLTVLLECSSEVPVERDPTQQARQEDQPRFFLTELSAHLEAWENGQVRSRLPLYAVLQPGSNLTAQISRRGGETSLRVVGDPQPNALTVPLFLTYQSVPQTPPRPARLLAAGVGASGDPDPLIVFAAASETPWTSPEEVRIRVLVDTNGDGNADARLENHLLTEDTDTFSVRVCPLPSGACQNVGPLGGLSPEGLHLPAFLTRIMVLPVRASQLGLTAGSLAFWFDTSDAVGPATRTPSTSFDPFNPPVRLSSPGLGPAWPVQPGQELALAVASGQGPRLLLLFPYNRQPWQVQVLPLAGESLRRRLRR